MPPFNYHESISVGVVQTTLNNKVAWEKRLHISDVEEERAIAEIKQHAAALSRETPKPRIILLPELAVPLGFLKRLKNIAVKTNTIFVGGMDFQHVRNSSPKKAQNRAVVVIPNKWGDGDVSSTATVKYVGKTYPAWREERFLNSVKYGFHSIPEVWIFEAGPYGRFAVVVCVDLLDLDRVSMYRLDIQHLFILAYNPDISSFDHAAQALSRMIFCNVVICNTGTYGGSLALSPYHKEERRVIYRHSGFPLPTSQKFELPVKSLIEAQTLDPWPADKIREFKSRPPGAKMKAVLKKRTRKIKSAAK